MNIPAFPIVLLITYIVYIGIKESRTANNIFVIIKLAVIFLVIVAGAFYVKPTNWSNFMPNGFSGVMSGVSAVFFAYIGFDAISTTAEECKNPQRDLPKAMFNTLIICTVLIYCFDPCTYRNDELFQIKCSRSSCICFSGSTFKNW